MDWIEIDDATWSQLEAAAAEKDVRSDAADWTRRMRPNFNLVGLAGEYVYAQTAGLPFRPERFGDGGEDFPGVDVKTTTRYASAQLLVPVDDPMRAPAYALVALDLDRRRGVVAGWTYRADVISAPTVDYGYGPSHCLRLVELRPGVVPPAAALAI